MISRLVAIEQNWLSVRRIKTTLEQPGFANIPARIDDVRLGFLNHEIGGASFYLCDDALRVAATSNRLNLRIVTAVMIHSRNPSLSYFNFKVTTSGL
jgi:hypothetical protein